MRFVRAFGDNPQRYYYRAEAVKQLLYGKELDDQLMSRVFLEDIFTQAAEAFTNYEDSDKDIALLKYLVDPFSYEDAQSVFETWDRGRVIQYVGNEVMKLEENQNG